MDMVDVRAAFVGTRSTGVAARRLGCSQDVLHAFLDDAPDDDVMALALLLEETNPQSR